MSNVPRSRPQGQLKQARPTHGTCRLTLTINGTSYRVRPNSADGTKAFRLKKSNGTVYDIVETAYGLECDCPDFIFHRDGLDPEGCKHLKSLIACGLLASQGGRR